VEVQKVESIPQEGSVEKLLEITTEGYTDLAKWLIGLSTGAIVFTVRLIKPDTSVFWRGELVFGLCLLIVSILLGVRYVKLRLDYANYNLEAILNTQKFGYFSKLPQNSTYEFDGGKQKLRT